MPSSVRPLRRLPLTYFSGFMALITLLVLSSGPVYAEWLAIFENPQETIYTDPDTIRRKGEMVKMWLLFDEKTQGNVRSISYLSLKAQSEYDCAEERSRLLASTWFSGNMGSGKVVFSSSDHDEWAPVEPVSLGRQLWKFACDKK
jgi:hypothetical protein